MAPTRRGIITGFFGILAAPATVRASSLMPVKVMPEFPCNLYPGGLNYVPEEVLAYRGEFIKQFELGVRVLLGDDTGLTQRSGTITMVSSTS